ncbi:MAG: hypothetical protein U5S82_23955 [Gammaproteobacteria bacterium]|nr:hypothetical protein [Gammaproteobacteria bacterium]
MIKDLNFKKASMRKLIIGAALALPLLGFSSAQAATVEFETVSFLSSESNIFNDTFTVSADGVYTATLTDFEFPTEFNLLIMSVASATESKVQLFAPGQSNFSAEAGTTYFINVAGDPGNFGSLNLGQFGAEIAAVPVPAAVWLLGSALVGLVSVSRARAHHA